MPAIVTLALGIGASTVVFAILNAVLIQPLPYRDPDRLIALFLKEPQQTGHRNPTSPREFRQWQKSGSVQDMTAATPWAPVLTRSGNPDQLHGLRASASLFRMLGIQPLLGRTFYEEEGVVGKNHVVVLGYSLWKRKFDGDASVVGKNLILDGESYLVAGVMPKAFQFPPFWATEAELWTPLAFSPKDWESSSRFLRVFARLKNGFSFDQAKTELTIIGQRIAHDEPQRNAGTAILIEPLREPVVSGLRPAILLLFAAVGFLFLIACANVANLQLVRAHNRKRENAINLALGASFRHLLSQSLAEGLLLAGAGGFLGLMLAFFGTLGFESYAAVLMPKIAYLRIDARVFWFAFTATMITSLTFGIIPLWKAARNNTLEALQETGRSTSSVSGNRMRQSLAIVEISVAIILMTGAGLLLRTFWKIRNVETGFRPERVLTATISLAGSTYTDAEKQTRFIDELSERLHQLGGIESAGFANFLPIGGDLWGMNFEVEGLPKPLPDQTPHASFRVVSPGYFHTMDTALIYGRDFSQQDSGKSLQVVVINQTLAKRFWSGTNAVGKRIRWASEDPNEPWLTVIGVVQDVRTWDLTDEIRPEVYFPFSQNPASGYNQFTAVVRTVGEPLHFSHPLQETVWSLNPNLPVSEIRTMDEILTTSIEDRFVRSILLAGLAILGLLLAAVGIYGVVSYNVAQRFQEIGIRMALGADVKSILRMIAWGGVKLAVLGLGFGIAGALALSRFLKGFLFGIRSFDPFNLFSVSLILILVIFAACILPAIRASKVDPVTALR